LFFAVPHFLLSMHPQRMCKEQRELVEHGPKNNPLLAFLDREDLPHDDDDSDDKSGNSQEDKEIIIDSEV